MLARCASEEERHTSLARRANIRVLAPTQPGPTTDAAKAVPPTKIRPPQTPLPTDHAVLADRAAHARPRIKSTATRSHVLLPERRTFVPPRQSSARPVPETTPPR